MLTTWTMKDGTKIAVRDMETRHILNAKAMLERKGFISPSTLSFYLFGPTPNGEMAMDCYEREVEEICKAPVSKALDWFDDELKTRGKL